MTPEITTFIDSLFGYYCGTTEAPRHTASICLQAITEGVPGCFIECGIAAGAEVAVMARCAMTEQKPYRAVHGVDNFEGIPRGGPKDERDILDLVGRGDYRESSGVSGCPLETVHKLMSQWGVSDAVTLHKGWFDDVLPSLSKTIGPISVLRLDANLYLSTKCCVEHLFPLLSSGAFVIVDDSAAGVWKAVNEGLGGRTVEVHEAPGTSAGGVVGVQWFRWN
jgi:hypothetical protein